MSLQILNVSKSFGEKKIIENLTLNFRENGLFMLLGESGVGKTTLLRMISGLDTDYAGEITGGGFSQVSFAFQEYRLIPTLSALNNILCAVSDKKDAATKSRAEELLFALGFTEEDMNLFPAELSGGMKQRVSLARAIIKKSPILLLDEPTKELDGENAELAIKAIVAEKEKRLVLVVTHKPEELQNFCDGVIHLKKAVV